MAYVAGDRLWVVRGTISGTEEFANTWATQSGGDVADDDLLAQDFNDFYAELANGAAPIWSADVSAVSIRCVDLFSGAEIPVSWTVQTGSNGNPLLPPEVALRVSLGAFSNIRGGPFLPSPTNDVTDDFGQLTTAYQNVVRDAMAALTASIIGHDALLGLHSPTQSAVLDLLSGKVGKTFDVIRARRNNMPESYLAFPVA